MDLTFLTQAIANLTTRLNQIVENARNILQLPQQTNIDSSSLIHVARPTGATFVSEKLTVQQILDAALSYRQNQLLSIGTITVVDNDVTIPAGATWVINNIDYSNVADIVINVPYAEEENTRTDIIVADQFNNMYRVNGPETEGVSPAPNVPLNTVLVTTINVTDSTIDTTPPIIGTDYELLANKQNSLAVDGTGTKYLTVDAANAAFSAIVINDATTTVKGIVKLAGDLGGTADLPTVPALANKADLVSGKVPASQLPSYVDDVIEGYLLSNVFYVESGHTTIIPAETGKIYIDLTTGQKNKEYRYSGSTYIQITNGLIASTADVPEDPSFLYFTTARVLATILTGISFATGGAIVSTDSVLIAFGKLQKEITDLITTVSGKQDVLVSGTNIKTINSASILGSGNLNTPDMDTTTAQTVSGVKTFLNGTLGLRNAVNTFTSFFTNTNTASRTYTLQNRNGILLDDTDLSTINTAISGKQSIFSGVANYITKSINSTTLGISRLLDTGTYLGIGTLNAPLKDISLGNQVSREIGVEDSDSLTVGRDLTITAGRAINFLISFLLQPLSQTPRNYTSMWVNLATNDVYVGSYNGSQIYKQTNATGPFILVSGTPTGAGVAGCITTSGDHYLASWTPVGTGIYKQIGGVGAWTQVDSNARSYRSMCSTPNGDVFASVGSSSFYGGTTGDIYKQTGGTGAFVAMGLPAQSYTICAMPNNDIYVAVMGGSIYKILAGTTTLVDTLQTNRQWYGVAATPSGGDVYACVFGGDIYKQTGGTGAFVATGQSGRNYHSIAISTSLNVYCCVISGDIYYVNINSLGTANLNGGTKKEVAGTGKGTGQSRWQVWTGQKTTSGTDMQVSTLRIETDEDGRTSFFGVIKLKGYTVATLPTGTIGDTAYVTDAATPTFLNTVIGGGSIKCRVFYDGANWIVN